jgi:hypothetical protein
MNWGLIAGWVVAAGLIAAPMLPNFGHQPPHHFHPKPHELDELQRLPSEEYALWLGQQRKRSRLGPKSQLLIVVVPPQSAPVVAATAQDDEYDTESPGGFPLPWPKVADEIATRPQEPKPIHTHEPHGKYHHHITPLTGEVPTYLVISRFEPERSWWGLRSASLFGGITLAGALLYWHSTHVTVNRRAAGPQRIKR